jgi:hypothetical protein
MLGMPERAIVIDRILGLHFMTILARGGLRAALCFHWHSSQQEDAESQKEHAHPQEEK